MNELECRFYPLTEIREITKQYRARDIKNVLTKWQYEFKWHDRQGVDILGDPKTPLERFTSMARQVLHIDPQIDCKAFAWFIMLLVEDDDYSSMPWAVRSEILFNVSGIQVDERTLRNWAKYLFKGDFLSKDKEAPTIWYTKHNGTARDIVQDPANDEDYCEYLRERQRILKEKQAQGDTFKSAYKSTMFELLRTFGRIYYHCYRLQMNAFNQDILFELAQLAHEYITSTDQTSDEDSEQ